MEQVSDVEEKETLLLRVELLYYDTETVNDFIYYTLGNSPFRDGTKLRWMD